MFLYNRVRYFYLYLPCSFFDQENKTLPRGVVIKTGVKQVCS